MDYRRVTVEYYSRDHKIMIEATMTKRYSTDKWECDTIHSVYYDGFIFDLDTLHPDFLSAIERELLDNESTHGIVEELYNADDYTEWTGPVSYYEELAEVGQSPKDFYWSNN